MERFLVIEIDSKSHGAWVYEVSREFTDGVVYKRLPTDRSVINTTQLDPKFYGKLDALLVDAAKIKNAAPVTPEYPPEPSVREMLADMEHAGATEPPEVEVEP